MAGGAGSQAGSDEIPIGKGSGLIFVLGSAWLQPYTVSWLLRRLLALASKAHLRSVAVQLQAPWASGSQLALLAIK